jgi:hypothetical protein
MADGTRLHFCKESQAPDAFRSAVSLHSHTSSSRELLDFIPRIVRGVPGLEQAEAAYRRRFERINGYPLDYSQAWWTPPLSPVEALQVESRQIESLGLHPLVSISDHDTIDGVWSLRSLDSSRDTIVSVEWTVPFGCSFFHLGIHNLPAEHARQAMAQFAEFTEAPSEPSLAELLSWVNGWRDALVVFNHPLWDEKGIGASKHMAEVNRFLGLYKPFLHALELNGLRPWKENKAVTELGRCEGLPLISGGDRHGMEPNANLNLTNALTFGDFVTEIRVQKHSEVLFMPQYQHALTVRVIDTLADVLRANPSHSLGWARWSDRVFRRERSGAIRPLSAYWDSTGNTPTLVNVFVHVMKMAESRHFKSAMRAAFGAQEEMAW